MWGILLHSSTVRVVAFNFGSQQDQNYHHSDKVFLMILNDLMFLNELNELNLRKDRIMLKRQSNVIHVIDWGYSILAGTSM